ncbi:MAG TPA: NAD(P)/FAD-dependent oxidoreductase [Candidatus Dormibacteraeota bacterium]|nr:NAD(P)/FAD-dependent oxidoreductase [Candidatus Dormibacteraeota bacterium]
MGSGETYDVIVVGGGPAGSTAGTLLSRRGYDVLVLEKEKFPREHVGESMLPFCYKLFEDLGVRDEMARTFVRKPGVRFVDRFGNASTTWCFSHVIRDETYLSFQVNRSEFDTILLNNTRRHGADVRELVKVQNVDLSNPESVTVESVDGDGVERVHRARFLIDASGRDALIGSKMGWRKPREELDRTAIWSHWTGVKMAGGLEEGCSVIVYIGEEKKGWIWVFPLTEDRITAGVVMQNSYIRQRRHELQNEGSTDWKTDLMYQELRNSPYVAGLLNGAEQALPVLVNGNYSYEVTNHYGTNYAMIGDARGFIDPIFSSGVFLSIKTAYLVTDALDEKLSSRTPGVTDKMVEAYRLVTGAYGFVHRMIRLFYNPHAVTWAQVGADAAVHRAHESAMAAGHFMLSGDFFENHERYTRFFELLESPDNFWKYKKFIMDRTEYQELSCRTPHVVAFGGRTDRFVPEEAEVAI